MSNAGNPTKSVNIDYSVKRVAEKRYQKLDSNFDLKIFLSNKECYLNISHRKV